MLTVRGHWLSIMVLFAIGLHTTWSILLLVDPATANATAVHALLRYIPNTYCLSVSCMTVAVCASIGLWTKIPWVLLLLMPQQIFLMMSAAGYVEAVWLSQFADGVIRSRSFIAADQLYCMLAAFGHTAAIIAHARTVLK